MRVSDLLMSNSYLKDISSLKGRIDKLNRQVANQSSILKPSDSPTGTAKVLRLMEKYDSNSIYLSSIQNSLGFVDESIRGMEVIEKEISEVLAKLTEANSAINNSNLSAFAEQLDKSINVLLDAANIKYDGKYVFGGTDFSSNPFSLTTDKSAVKLNVNDVSGESRIKLSQNSSQKINLSGIDLFGTINKQNGTLSNSAAVGDTFTDSMQVYDVNGSEFTLNLTYTKTAAHKYQLDYDIVDSSNNSVYSTPPASKQIGFDPSTGIIVSLDGKSASEFVISDSSNKINFLMDLGGLKEKNDPTSLSHSANQKQDIFNTLIKIRDGLNSGVLPAPEDFQMVKDFHQRTLNNLSEAGNIYTSLNNSNDLLENQKLEIERLISKEKDLDMAKAIMDLQNYDYMLQISYKMSAMILPKSLLDYL